MRFECKIHDSTWSQVFKVLESNSMAGELEEAVQELSAKCVDALEKLLDKVDSTYGHMEVVIASLGPDGTAELEFDAGYNARQYAPLVAKWLIAGGATDVQYEGIKLPGLDDEFWHPIEFGE